MRWINIKGFAGYEVSDSGLIKSIKRPQFSTCGRYNIRRKRIISERILKQSINGSGYLFVSLRKKKKHYSTRVHILVANHFLGKKPNGLIVCHKDHNKMNNNILNLEYGTHSKNTKDYYRHSGRSRRTIPLSHVSKIIARINNGETAKSIAKEYNIWPNDVSILNRIYLD